MKTAGTGREKVDKALFNRLKPFTIVGAAIALGLIGFDPDEPVEAEPVEQMQEDLRPISEDFNEGMTEGFRIQSELVVRSAPEDSPGADRQPALPLPNEEDT